MNKTLKYILFYTVLILIWVLFTHNWIVGCTWLFNQKADWSDIPIQVLYILFSISIFIMSIITYVEKIFD